MVTGGGDEFDLEEVAGNPRFAQLDEVLIFTVDVDGFTFVLGIVAQISWGHL